MDKVEIGNIFGRWSVIGNAERYSRGQKRFLCQCSCGSVKTVSEYHLQTKASRSCGCIRDEILKKRFETKGGPNLQHGGSFTSEYSSWHHMKDRCLNPKHHAYKSYGGRGIRICKRWINSFFCFLKDVGTKPSPSHSLDRINNNKGYFPRNVRWATPKQQANNRNYK